MAATEHGQGEEPKVPWYRFEKIELTKRQKIALRLLIAFSSFVLFGAFGTESIDYPKVAGLSLEPTIHQWIYVPWGAPEVRHRGAYVHIDRHRKAKVGWMMMFRHGDETDVKRVAKIRQDGALWVISDNVGVTGADSRDLGWIDPKDFVGVIDQIITPQTLFNACSVEGRLWNQALLTCSPSQRFRSRQGEVIVQTKDGAISLGTGSLLRHASLDVHASMSDDQARATRKVRQGNLELWGFSGGTWNMISLDARSEFIKVRISDDEIVIGGRQRTSNASPNPLTYACVASHGRVTQVIATPEMVSPTVVVKTRNRLVVQGGVGHHFPPGVQPQVMTVELKKVKGVWKVSKSGLTPALKL